MNKKDLIEKIAKETKITKALAERSIDSIHKAIKWALKKRQNVILTGFGTFSVIRRAARKGRNIQTGETIKIRPKKVVKFKPGEGLKKAVK